MDYVDDDHDDDDDDNEDDDSSLFFSTAETVPPDGSDVLSNCSLCISELKDEEHVEVLSCTEQQYNH